MDGSKLHFIDSYHLLSYDELDSTNEEAKRLALAGGQHGAVIWSKSQYAGKGRSGREWISREGNLFCSILLQPCAPLKNLPQLSFVSSLAVFEALKQVVEPQHRLMLKWPNDILLDDKKLGGILLETIPIEDSDACWVIIGVGINVEHYPKETLYPATSLKAAGVEIISAKIVLSRFLNCFEPLYDEWLERGFDAIRSAWLEKAAFHNKMIVIKQDEQEVSGIFSDIDMLGHIVIKDKAQQQLSFAAGDVSMRSECY